MKKIIFITSLFFLSFDSSVYWSDLRRIEKGIFEKMGLYTTTREELKEHCQREGKKFYKAYGSIEKTFLKAENVIAKFLILYENHILVKEPVTPFYGDIYTWVNNRNTFFREVYSIFMVSKELSLLEITHIEMKMEIFRKVKDKFLRCSIIPLNASYRCGNEIKKVYFSPYIGFCYSDILKNREINVRLEFFGSKEYLNELCDIRRIGFKSNYICFDFNEKGNMK